MQNDDKLLSSIIGSLYANQGKYIAVLSRSLLRPGTPIDWLAALKTFSSVVKLDAILVESDKRTEVLLQSSGFSTTKTRPTSEQNTSTKALLLQFDEIFDEQDSQIINNYLNARGLLIFGVDPAIDAGLFDLVSKRGNDFFPSYWFCDGPVDSATMDIFSSGVATPVFAPINTIFAKLTNMAGTLLKHHLPPATVQEIEHTSVPIEDVEPEAKSVVKVLSIDGGGIRGIIPAVILRKIEAETGRPITQLFDLIIGTSTGGILAMGLGLATAEGNPRLSAIELAQMYLQRGLEIFPPAQNRIHPIASILSSIVLGQKPDRGLIPNKLLHFGVGALTKFVGALQTYETERGKIAAVINKCGQLPYSSQGLENVLRDTFGEHTTMGDLLGDILITAYELESRRARIFSSRLCRATQAEDKNLLSIARATSAAPSYFQPVYVDNNGIPQQTGFVDGGLFANNPAFCGYAEAKRIFGRDKKVLLVSLGTGEDPPPYNKAEADSWVAGQWMVPTVDILMHGSSQNIHNMLASLLSVPPDEPRQYFRFQPKLTHCEKALDAATADNIERLAIIATNLIEQDVPNDFQAMLSELTKPDPEF